MGNKYNIQETTFPYWNSILPPIARKWNLSCFLFIKLDSATREYKSGTVCVYLDKILQFFKPLSLFSEKTGPISLFLDQMFLIPLSLFAYLPDLASLASDPCLYFRTRCASVHFLYFWARLSSASDPCLYFRVRPTKLQTPVVILRPDLTGLQIPVFFSVTDMAILQTFVFISRVDPSVLRTHIFVTEQTWQTFCPLSLFQTKCAADP